MKTYKNLFEEVCKFNNLYNSYLKAKKCKSNSLDVLKFGYNLENELFKLQEELKTQTFKTGKYRHFIIFEPKERKISALPFRDRIVHHAICAVIEPIFEKKFIYDSYACRKRKGTHAGVERLQKFIQNVKELDIKSIIQDGGSLSMSRTEVLEHSQSSKNFEVQKSNANMKCLFDSNKCYVLKCDVSKYFSSVNSEILKQIIREKISDKKLLYLLDTIIDSSQQGIPIGNLTSQLFANIYLNKFDEYIKYELKIKYYIRYMDDFVMLHQSKTYLNEVKEKVKVFFLSMRLTLHPKKAVIFPLTLGVDFLGYRIFNDKKLVRKSTVKRFIKGVKVKIRKYDYGDMKFDKLMESFNSWNAYMSYADSYALKKDIQERYLKNVA
jgi:RNA-directed DNA polymerase